MKNNEKYFPILNFSPIALLLQITHHHYMKIRQKFQKVEFHRFFMTQKLGLSANFDENNLGVNGVI